jgi:hypothetical protein
MFTFFFSPFIFSVMLVRPGPRAAGRRGFGFGQAREAGGSQHAAGRRNAGALQEAAARNAGARGSLFRNLIFGRRHSKRGLKGRDRRANAAPAAMLPRAFILCFTAEYNRNAEC